MQFRVIVSDEDFQTGNINNGVPQGTNIRPLLFITHKLTLQYMLYCYKASYHLYADDMQSYFNLNS